MRSITEQLTSRVVSEVIIEQSEEERRAKRNKANNPFELYPDFGNAEHSMARARDARIRGLSNLDKIQSKTTRETLDNDMKWDRVGDRIVDVTDTLAGINPLSGAGGALSIADTFYKGLRAIEDRELRGVGQDIGTDEYEGRRAQGVQDRLRAGEQTAPAAGGQVMGMRATSPGDVKRIEDLAQARPRKKQMG
jgi:hypothetical protein